MDIYEIHEELIINNGEVQFKDCNAVEFNCPTCNEHLVTHRLTGEILNHELSQSFLYDDGDLLDDMNSDYSKISADMMFGNCKKCGNEIANIKIYVFGQDIGSFYINNEGNSSLMITSPDDLIKRYADIKLVNITIQDESIGYMVHYKNVELNNDAMLYKLSNIHQDNIYIIDLEFYYDNKSPQDIWSIGTEILKVLTDTLSKSYIKEYFDKDSKEDIIMTEEIKKTLLDSFAEIDEGDEYRE